MRKLDFASVRSMPDQLAERIVKLGKEPNLSPEWHSEYVEGTSFVEMIIEDLRQNGLRSTAIAK